MQTKSSYRVLKWTFILGAIASLASACVVTSGDDDDDFGEGGEGGSTPTAGTKTGGTNATAGKTATGGGGSSSTAGTAAGGEGGAVSSYVPGLCESDSPTPTMEPSCELDAKDMDAANACRTCLKTKCCDDWQGCFGDTPATACGSGSTEAAPGQFECIRGCYLDNIDKGEPDMVLGDCEGMCLDQCEQKDDGFALTDTQSLLGCGQDNCLAECFTP